MVDTRQVGVFAAEGQVGRQRSVVDDAIRSDVGIVAVVIHCGRQQVERVGEKRRKQRD
jgi:hypothetical protein